MERLVTLHGLAVMSKRNVNDCLRMAQESNALRLRPEDTNIYVNIDVFQDHLDKIINEEIKVLNGKESED